jgi:hypothetical protein
LGEVLEDVGKLKSPYCALQKHPKPTIGNFTCSLSATSGVCSPSSRLSAAAVYRIRPAGIKPNFVTKPQPKLVDLEEGVVDQKSLFHYEPHPHIARRREQGPVKVADQHPRQTAFGRFNTWLALKVTTIVGTMVCAYLFMMLTLVSLPSAVSSGNLLIIVSWIAQTFLQLVLLPIIIVGQNVQAAASDKRAEQTYRDAEAVLHEAQQIQAHLLVQDKALQALAGKLGADLGQLASPEV